MGPLRCPIWVLLMCMCVPGVIGWDTGELEMFDLVEEINENFYQVMGISQEATLSEIKKAYRRLSLVLHPDKNDAEDAELKFRQLVGIYEVLKDEGIRASYNRVLVEGLPDWRSPIYYYRRARKMSMLEISVILMVVISITQYLMAWGTYIDRRHTLEENLIKRFKIKDKRKKKPEDIENIQLMDNAIAQIPRPSWWNILPIQLVKLSIFLVTGGPGLVREAMAYIREERERKEREKREEEEEEQRILDEEEKRKEKKASRKENRKRVNILPDFSNGDCILDAVDAPENQTTRHVRPPAPSLPVVTGGPWTDDDFCELSRLMAKYPGGTVDRWEKIAEFMGRTVFEVTKMSSKVKSMLMNRHTEGGGESEEAAAEAKMKVKTKGEKDLSAGSDEMWSAVQHKALEKALKQFPKGTDQRWDKIARAVPDKAKEDCMLRFKFLAEKIRKKKMLEQEDKPQDDAETNKEEEEHEDDAKYEEEEEVKNVNKKKRRNRRKKRMEESESEEEEEEEEDYY